jgi:hypothetical protein
MFYVFQMFVRTIFCRYYECWWTYAMHTKNNFYHPLKVRVSMWKEHLIQQDMA